MPLKTSVSEKNKTLGIKWNWFKINAEVYQIAEQPVVSKTTQHRRILRSKSENMCHSRQEPVKETDKKPFCWVSVTDKLTNVPLSWGTQQAEPCRWSQYRKTYLHPVSVSLSWWCWGCTRSPSEELSCTTVFRHLTCWHKTYSDSIHAARVGRKQLSACAGQTTDCWSEINKLQGETSGIVRLCPARGIE